MTKMCFKCDKMQPVGEFYAHPRMKDGRLGKCKTCTKRDVAYNYAARRAQYSTYERKRFKDPERKAKVKEYQRRMRSRNPEKAAARNAVSNAIRDGRLVRGSCSHCGAKERVQAHHHDYSKPLDVVWACFRCHREHEHGQTVTGEPTPSLPS